MSRPVVELTGVTKRFGRTVAVDELSLAIGPGELVGLLGANGAGKTTVVKLLLGLTRPTAGGGQILGSPLGDRAARRRIGYLPELFRYQPWLRAREVLALHARLAGLVSEHRGPLIDDALAMVGLGDRRETPVGAFSKGMQQRLGLAVAFLGSPDVVLLDEPTSALDPLGRVDVREMVRALRERGTTVILNSHLLTEVERVCDRVVILRAGRVAASGSLDDVLGTDRVRIRVDGLAAEALAGLAALGSFTIESDGLVVDLAPGVEVPDLVAAIVGAGGRVHEVGSGRQSLEARFIELVSGETGVTR